MNTKVLIFSLLIVQIECFFEVILDRFDVLEQDTSINDWSKLRVKKVNKTSRVLIGEVTSFVKIGNDVLFEAILLKKQGNEYRYTPYKVEPTPFCDAIKSDSNFNKSQVN